MKSPDIPGRLSVVAALVAVLVGLLPGAAWADTVTNSVTAGGNDTVTAGATTPVSYTLNATHDSTDPGQSAQCNAKTNSPVSVTIRMTVPSGTTATVNPSSLSFTSCAVAQAVSLGASKPGDYPVSITTTAAGVDTSAAAFTLHVKSTDTTPPVLTLPADQTVEATSATGAKVTYAASAFDAGDNATVPVSCSPSSGTTFPLGTTTVGCTAQDSHSNVATGSFKVTVQDSTGPVLSLSDTAAEATGPNGAKVTYAASATDAVDGSTQVSCSPASGSMFAIGVTTVSCTSTDSHGNTSSGTLKVTVRDTTAPSLTLPTTTVAEAASGAGATVNYIATASDLVDGPVTPNCDHPSGATFSLGDTTVTCTATDSHNNTATASFTVTVGDHTAPTLNLTSTTVEATGPDGAAVNYDATASDTVDGAIAPDCEPASGTTFALGTTTVHCSATDSHGNTAMGDLTVTVQDHTAPTLTLSDQTGEATGPHGAKVTYTTSATDLVDGTVSVSCSQDSGSTFPVGDTTVTCSATDAAGNVGRGSFTVHIVDTTPPTVLVSDQTAEATGPHGAPVSYDTSATDAVDGTDPVHCDTASGATFPLGDTTVTCTATDNAGNTGTGSFTVTVVDTTAPAITADSKTAEATGPNGAHVNFAATATDAVDGTDPVTCDRSSSDLFPLGDTTFACSATDAHHNFATTTVTITVVDTTPPEITTTDQTAEATGPDGATVTFDTTAVDLVDGSVPTTCTPVSGSVFRLGKSTVTCTATDAHGNTGAATATITVRDTTAPELHLADQTVEATGPDGVAATFNPAAHDLVSGDVPVTCDHDSGATYPLGDTIVTCSARDAAGNTAQGEFTITVGDHTAPALHLTDGDAEATGPAGATVNYDATAVDLVDGARPVHCNPASGSTFPIAVTPVDCSSSDTRGNTATGSLHVTVHDHTPPALTLTDQKAEATGPDGAKVSYTATATDIVDGNVDVSCAAPSGTTFPIGVTTVHCTATDAHGNPGNGTFTVTVKDTTPPKLNLPDNITTEATGPAGAKVNYTATAADAVDSSDPVSCDNPSGTTFALGTTTVTCGTSDQAGNPASGSFTVTVQDTTAPTLTLPASLRAEATGPSGATVTYTATATDAVDGTDPVHCDTASGATFPLGDTVVTCYSADHAGNTASGGFTVTVADGTPPALPNLPDINLTATSAAGATATYNFTATDAVDGTDPVTCAPPSGTTFKLGSTQVSCTATDKVGNTSDAQSFNVHTTMPWSGVIAPLNSDGSSVYKIGSTIPVKFLLTGTAAGITNLPAKLYYAKVSNNQPGSELEAVSTSAADTGNQFRYDTTGKQYIFNLSTKAFTEGTYQLLIDLGDGITHTVNITSKK